MSERVLDERMLAETKIFVSRFLATNNLQELLKLDPQKFRDLRASQEKLLNSQLKFENIEEKEYHVENTGDGYKVPVSAYIPKGEYSKTNIIVFIHGGGWNGSSRATYYAALCTLAEQTNSIWLSIEYRLAPENKFPVGLNDCESVVNWVFENRTSLFNLNENAAVGVSGDSAGGNLAVTLAHELKSKISFQILIYPVVEPTYRDAVLDEFSKEIYLILPEYLKFCIDSYIRTSDDLIDPRVTPLLYEKLDNLSKCCIIAAELDPIRTQSTLYYDKLVSQNIYCELHEIKGTVHGYFNVPMFLPEAFGKTCQYIISFLTRVNQ